MDFEKMLDEELKKNKELKEVFDSDPTKREAYIEKLKDSWDMSVGYTDEEKNKKTKHCKTCMFAHGEPPFADLPDKAYCMIYQVGDGSGKPKHVYFDGEPCEYYEKA